MSNPAIRYIFLSITLLLIHGSYCIFSQENSIYQNYYLSPFIVNPALTGANYYPSGEISVKKQWLSFPDAPTTFLLAANYRIGKYDFYDPKGFINTGPLKLADRIALGAALFRDVNGPITSTGGIISYAYQVPVNDKTRLSFGMSILGSYFSFNSSLLKPDQINDPYLFTGNDNFFSTNFNLGICLINNNYFFGFSADKLLPYQKDVNLEKKEHPSLFLVGGYKFFNNYNAFILEPSVAFKLTESKYPSVDIHTKLYIKRLNWIAVSYSSIGMVNFRFALKVYRLLHVGYNYEYTISDVAHYNLGSHEIYLGINPGLMGIEGIGQTK